MARVRAFLGEAAKVAALVNRAEVAAALGTRQAGHEVRTARAELALYARRPGEALKALDGHADDSPILVSWAEIMSEHPGITMRRARAEAARAERTGERLAEVEARIALATALHRLGRTPEGTTELTRAVGIGPGPAASGGHTTGGMDRDLLGDTTQR
ncbi:hypothetical protein [Streptomyces sp. NPDC004330]|uniref:hypothetical protein n=1 Tax=Streptomyces sp. NPDC004330 TaxID=3364700 RepID=UPI0036AE2BA9